MIIQQNISLKNYNTFGVEAIAKRFVIVNSFFELQEVVNKHKDLFLLSGGSNLLLTKDIEKLVILINIKGVSIDKEDNDYAYITVNAGENWHEFVLWSISQNYGGLENLSLIPGNVGTSPIQNIGAYGVEVKDAITKVDSIEIESGKRVSFSNQDCEFGYRNSIFKNDAKGKYIITSVCFRLSRNNHKLNTSYGAIETALQQRKVSHPTIKDISEAVIEIRQSKLPDPAIIGNGGSFFKNPVIEINKYKSLKETYSQIPNYPVSETHVKVPAGWLIEQCGYKGKRFGDAGVHEKQALVIVNHGNATGKEIFQLAKKIKQSVYDTFKIDLEIEVTVI